MRRERLYPKSDNSTLARMRSTSHRSSPWWTCSLTRLFGVLCIERWPWYQTVRPRLQSTCTCSPTLEPGALRSSWTFLLDTESAMLMMFTTCFRWKHLCFLQDINWKLSIPAPLRQGAHPKPWRCGPSSSQHDRHVVGELYPVCRPYATWLFSRLGSEQVVSLYHKWYMFSGEFNTETPEYLEISTSPKMTWSDDWAT